MERPVPFRTGRVLAPSEGFTLRKETETKYHLRSCLWELTLKCNMNCLHCGSTAGAKRDKELILDECLCVADELIDIGCRDVTFIGGEIFLYPMWETVARYLADAGVLVNIMSNGYRMRDKQVKQIRHACLTNVGVSIDGMEENHNRIRGRSDGFAEAVKTLELLRQEGIPAGVVTTLLDFNYGDLEEMYSLFVEKGVDLWQIQLGNPMGNLAGSKYLVFKPENVPELTRFVREKNRQRKMAVLAADSVGYFDENETYIRGRKSPIPCWGGCQAGINSVFIDSVGNIKGCGSLYSDVFIEGNLRERSLAEIWNDETCFAYNRGFDVTMLTGECEGCALGDVCKGGCRASNFFNGGSMYENHYCSRNQVEVPARVASL